MARVSAFAALVLSCCLIGEAMSAQHRGILRVSNIQGQLMGCFQDTSSSPLFSHQLGSSSSNNVNNCAQRCFEKGYRISAPRGSRCSCAHQMLGHLFRAKTLYDCQSVVCPGDSGRLCGGSGTAHVYLSWKI